MHTFPRCAAGAALALGLLAGCKASQPAATAAELSAALPAGTPYALLHLYRPGRMTGFLIGYDVRLNDSVVYRARNGSQATVRVGRPGPVTLRAKTEAEETLSLELQPGREYYVRCTLGVGAVVGRPQLRQVRATEGQADVQRLNAPPMPAQP